MEPCPHEGVTASQDGPDILFHCPQCGRDTRWHNMSLRSLVYNGGGAWVMVTLRRQFDMQPKGSRER